MFSSKRSLDFTGLARVQFEPLASVVASLTSKTKLTSSQFMVVGAEARNLLHLSFGLDPAHLSTTSDVDIALAMPSWQGFGQLTPTFRVMNSSKSAIRFRIDDIPVDVIPFGGIEDPKGIVQIPDDSQQINVLGYTRAFECAEEFVLPDIGPVLVVSPPFYVILKLEALADRSKWHKTKDAEDIGTALTWVDGNENEDLIFEDEYELLTSNNFDMAVTVTELLGRQLAGLLDLSEHARLVDKVSELAISQFASDLRRGLFRGGQVNKSEAAMARFGALIKGLRFDEARK